MSVEIVEYTTKPISVLAVQLTPENIHEVADWCGGQVLQVKSRRVGIHPPEGLKLRILGGITRQVAFGEFIAKTDIGWVVCPEKLFTNSYIRKAAVLTVSE